MASNTAKDSQPAAPAEPTPTPVATEAAPSTPAASGENQGAGLGKVAQESPAEYMNIFEKIVTGLSENEKEIFIKGQLDSMKELERVNGELENAKKSGEKMQEMHKDNIAATMNAIRNFFLQGADEKQNVTDLGKIESVFQQHPELHHTLAPVINCAARRVEVAESSLKVQKEEQERSSEEKELFQRMRGFARDSAQPTYDYHGFEGRAGAKRPITENANIPSAAPPAKRPKIDYAQQQLNELMGHMKKSLPGRPNNIRMNERGLM